MKVRIIFPFNTYHLAKNGERYSFTRRRCYPGSSFSDSASSSFQYYVNLKISKRMSMLLSTAEYKPEAILSFKKVLGMI